MDRNFALEKADLAAGFVLTCQAHPLTERWWCPSTNAEPRMARPAIAATYDDQREQILARGGAVRAHAATPPRR
jgi:hypothetical protein